jgi:SAM-dependent methyltransferase
MAEVEISGDVALSGADRVRYLWRNACRNLRALGQGPSTRAFHPDLAQARRLMAGQSPGRLAAELFFASELPRLLPPGRIEVVEIGCGSGRMAESLARLGYGGRYTGVDIRDRFRRDHPADFPFEVRYRQVDAHLFAPLHPLDLMISHSTLEHVPRDWDLLARFSGLFKPGGVELHVVPSGASLAAYLWHGFRQYTPAALTARFGPRIEIVRIGGFGSLMLHVACITVPEMLLRRSLRRAAPGFYRLLLRAALRLDRVMPFCPTAYAVIRRH